MRQQSFHQLTTWIPPEFLRPCIFSTCEEEHWELVVVNHHELTINQIDSLRYDTSRATRLQQQWIHLNNNKYSINQPLLQPNWYDFGLYCIYTVEQLIKKKCMIEKELTREDLKRRLEVIIQRNGNCVLNRAYGDDLRVAGGGLSDIKKTERKKDDLTHDNLLSLSIAQFSAYSQCFLSKSSKHRHPNPFVISSYASSGP